MSTIHLIGEHLVSVASQPHLPGVLRGQALAAGQPHIVAAGAGLTDWATGKTTAWGTLLRLVTSVLAAPGFVLYHAIKSRGAMARILVAIIVSGVVVWGVFNVTQNQDRITNEINGAPAPAAAYLAPLHR